MKYAARLKCTDKNQDRCAISFAQPDMVVYHTQRENATPRMLSRLRRRDERIES